jgi:6-phosphogluconolactonase (cycloisomerase 2 family)
LVIGVILAATTLLSAQSERTNNLKSGAVYVMTNQVVNSVMAFARSPNTGALTLVDTEETGGAGDPVPIAPDPPTDPLASQGALAINDNNFIYAVNAGSNEISVLEVSPTGLSFVQKVASGGVRPISLTIRGDLLYVLNEGGTPNITGFTIDDVGMLTPIAGSTQPLIGGAMADPAQVGFSHDGSLLVVAEKAGNRLDTYQVDADGVEGPPMSNVSNGMTPFGFAFSKAGALIVSEAFGGEPGASAVSSYEANRDGLLNVLTGSVANGQTASCWVVTTSRYAFISNTASGTLSSYVLGRGALTLPSESRATGTDVSRSADLSLLAGVAANTGADSSPIDMALSNNNRFLYVHESGDQTVGAYEVGSRGDLTFIGEFGTIPQGAQGIASK